MQTVLTLGFRHAPRVALSVVRWWFGLTYVVAGVGAFIAGPIMVEQGNAGGVYMIVGGPLIAALGWAIHPWGFERLNARQSASTLT
jgi:hypothetical protein